MDNQIEAEPVMAAVIQLCSGPDRAVNLDEARRQMDAAVADGAKLIVLPENFSYMAESDREKQIQNREEIQAGESLVFLRDYASSRRVWVVGGSVPLKVLDPESNKMTNTCFVVDDQGEVRARYDKVHLFDAHLSGQERPYRESEQVVAGNEVVVVDTPFGKLGLAICYDLRFPEFFRLLMEQGATLIALPAAFTLHTGLAHWEVLLRARAIENFSYILASGQGGKHADGRETYGHSMIIDPWGTVVARVGTGSGAALARLDPQRVTKCRQQVPALGHRKFQGSPAISP